jgi:Domain of unknown function (DUF4440)
MQSVAATRGDISQHQLLEHLNAGYIRAVATGDGPWFQQNLAEDFLNSGADGSLLDKRGFIAQVVRPSGISGLTVLDVRIRIIEGTAIIHAQTRYCKVTGEPAAGRYTDVWILRNDHWECVAAHVTRG